MTNNDIIRKLRYALNLDDTAMIDIFAKADFPTNRPQVSNWLKKDEDQDFVEISDFQLASFLNGLIIEKRGKKEDANLEAEKTLNNNIIFRKLKIALNLRDEDILELFDLVNFRISKHEISAFFRNTNHKHYMECQDQILRNLIHGIQLKYRK